MMKKIIVTLGVLFGLTAWSTAAQAYDITISNASALPGETVTVALNYQGNAEAVQAFQTTIQYDESVLELNSIEKGDTFSAGEYTLTSNTSVAGEVRGGMFTTGSGNSGANGQAVRLNFTIKASAEKGDTLVRVTEYVMGNLFSQMNPANINNGTVTVEGTNEDPAFSSISTQTVNEGGTLSFSIPVSDSDGDDLTLTLNNKESWMQLNDEGNNAFRLSLTPGFEDSGTYSITLTADDGNGGVVTSNAVSIVVADVNRAPIFNDYTAPSVSEGELLNFTIAATDPDGGDVTVTVDPSTLAPWMSFDGASLTGTPGFDEPASYTVRFSAQDSSGETVSEDVVVTINNVNQAPILSSIGNKSVKAGETLSFTVTAQDADGDTLMYSIQGLPDELFKSATGEFQWEPTSEDVDVYTVTFLVDDGQGGIDSEVIEITVTEEPVVTITLPKGPFKVNENEELEIPVSATVTDDSAIAIMVDGLIEGLIEYVETDGASGVLRVTPGFNDATPEAVTVTITADTPTTEPDSRIVSIVINDVNRAPVLGAVGNKSVEAGETLTFTLTAQDPDGDPLSYGIESLSSSFLNSETGQFQWTPTADDVDEYKVTVFVTDDKGDMDSKDITITVTEEVVENQSPVLTPVENKTIEAGEILNITLSAQDPDNDTLSYSIEGLPENLLNSATGEFSWIPTEQDVGDYPVTFRVDDGNEGTDTITLSISVLEKTVENQPPVMSAIGDKTLDEGTTLEFTVSLSDPDDDDLRLSVGGLIDGWMSLLDNGDDTFTVNLFPGFEDAGSYNLTFRADDTKESVRERITVTVVNIGANEDEVFLDLENNEFVHNLVQISGSADVQSQEEEFVRYDLYYAPSWKPEAMTKFGSSREPVRMGTLGQVHTQCFNDGEYIITLKLVTTAGQYVETERVTVDNYPQPPVFIGLDDKIGVVGETLSFQVQARDFDKADNGMINVSAVTLPAGADFDPVTDTFTWTLQEDDKGVHMASFRVVDSSGQEQVKEISISSMVVQRALLDLEDSPEMTMAMPHIHDQYAAWNRGMETVIYNYLTAEKEVVDFNNSLMTVGWYPRVFENKIVMFDDKDGSAGIYLYDTETMAITPLHVTGKKHTVPNIQGNDVVWITQDEVFQSPASLGVYDLGRERLQENVVTTQDEVIWLGPDIDEGRMVWSEDIGQGSPADIFILDLDASDSLKQLTSDKYAQTDPAIKGDKMVWLDAASFKGASLSSGADLVIYDLLTREKEILAGVLQKRGERSMGIYSPDICGNNVVYVYDELGDSAQSVKDGYEVFYHNIAEGGQVKIAPVTQGRSAHSPKVYGNSIVYIEEDADQISSYLYMAEFFLSPQVKMVTVLDEDRIRIIGENFGDGRTESTVKLSSGATCAVESWSDTQITCRVPSNNVDEMISVVTPGGRSEEVQAFPNLPPEAHAGPDIKVLAIDGQAEVSFDGTGSFDPEGEGLWYQWRYRGRRVGKYARFTKVFPVGVHYMKLVVIEPKSGMRDEDKVKITVYEDENASSTNRPPVAVIEKESRHINLFVSDINATAPLFLDGSGSYDPDGNQLKVFQWRVRGVRRGWSDTVNLNLPVGKHWIALEVHDIYGARSKKDKVCVTVSVME